MFWLAVWHIISKLIGQEILLASPVSVLEKWLELVSEPDFWHRVINSYLRVMLGLFAGAAAGMLLGILSSASGFARRLFEPVIGLMRAVPVASFIILALVWLDKKSLGTFIAAIVCLPVFWSNTIAGINAADGQLLEMAKVFRLNPAGTLKAVYLPALYPFINLSFETTVGLAWKSGIAAELIAVPAGTVGEMLYYAKVWLATDEMLAWTFTAVVLSCLTEKLIKLLGKRAGRRYE